MNPEIARAMCEFPARLHPVSENVLDYYIAGVVNTAEFLRSFSLPNSDYIELARCFVDLLVGTARYG